MWTIENRARYKRDRLRYPGDVTGEEGAHVEPLIPPAKRGGRKREANMRGVFREPEQRVSKTGKPFVTAKLLVKDGEGGAFWNIVAFSETSMAEFMRLHEGEALSVQGRLKAEVYEKDGEKRFSLGVVAIHVLSGDSPIGQRLGFSA